MEPLRVLLIGNGGREHALAWKLSQSPWVEAILAVPGNGGTANCPKTTNVLGLSADDYPGLVELAKKEFINLVVPGPEAPLVDGIKDHFVKVGIPCFGPSKAAAQMEGSKTFAKDFMKRHGIPTAAYGNFSNYDEAISYLDQISHDVVIKATGLAAGKGVIIPTTKEEAKEAVKQVMVDKAFGSAGDEIVIEQFLSGEELSILTFSDGHSILSLPPAQDHKRIFDGDQGPNTGGMGCYAPTNIATKELIERIDDEIIRRTIDGMCMDRTPFVGCLFTGLMITKDGPKVLEYNVRFGDPETETLLPLLSQDTDLAEIMLGCTQGWLKSVKINIQPKFSATVVLVSGGYPGPYAKGIPITTVPPSNDTNIFHAGTTLVNGSELKTAGGRVFAVNATAQNVEAAVKKAYEGVGLVNFDGMFYRKDIAHRVLGRSAEPPKASLTYAQAGVDIDTGNEFVLRIKKAVASTKIQGADAEIGGFGGELDLSQCGFTEPPIVVGGIDGIGTKLIVSQAMKKHDTVGIDLVAMNVNDIVVQGARPLMFLDYYSSGKLELEAAASFVEGVAAGCRQAKCALVGGETAEMPGMFQGGHYEGAGAAFGAMTKSQRLPRKGDMVEGDVVLGLGSNGVHSNGFSLVRRIVKDVGLDYQDPAPWDGSMTVGESLLTPTRIYVQCLLPLLSRRAIKGLAHITGGGLVDNVPRMLPGHLAAEIDLTSFEILPVFRWLKTSGNVAPLEMCRTFNNGVGMVAVVDAVDAADVMKGLQDAGEKVFRIGHLVARPSGADGCTIKNLDLWVD